MEEFIFYIFATITAVSALFIAFTKNVLHAAFTLLATLLGISAIFVFAHAEFLAIAQILIYIGGILVLVIFGVLITSSYDTVQKIINRTFSIPYFIISMLIFTGLIYLINQAKFDNTTQTHNNLITQLESFSQVNMFGINIMTTHIIPFELTAILLMVALLGAALIAGRKND